MSTATAVVVALAAMLGTGLYAAFAPAAAAAGPWLPLAVLLALVVALCNVSAIADLTAARPGGGGLVPTDLPPAAGRLAGVARLVARGAAAAAAAGVFGAYVLPSQPVPVAILAVLVVIGLNAAGVRISVSACRGLVAGAAVVLLMVTIVGAFPSGPSGPSAALESAAAAGTSAELPVATLQAAVPGSAFGVLTAAAFVFFAFAGTSRVAELGGSLRDPLRTVRRASTIAVVIAGVIFLAVSGALLNGLGVDRLSTSPTPLASLIDTGGSPALGVLVRVGAAVATGSALLAVLSRGSQNAARMARDGELPRFLARTGSRGTPWVSDLLGGLLVVLVTVLVGPVTALAVSACAVLVHYALLHGAALRLPGRSVRTLVVGVVGGVLCLVLAVSLPTWAPASTAVLLVAGWLLSTLVARTSRASGDDELPRPGETGERAA
ncbi:APC family permease [Pseudonocardia sediminis]|uniref:APC family permease n=1 Tax=Pseudonocardia sediminis TaxID=1397368 RepID=UPI00102A9B80|nr:APC family permease [Pseudonocardia sediminis]